MFGENLPETIHATLTPARGPTKPFPIQMKFLQFNMCVLNALFYHVDYVVTSSVP